MKLYKKPKIRGNKISLSQSKKKVYKMKYIENTSMKKDEEGHRASIEYQNMTYIKSSILNNLY